MRKYILAAQHGDESFGIDVINCIESPDIVTRVGHPQAVTAGKRFIDQDLNRSFSSNNMSVESRIAHSIKKELEAYRPDFILDIHTSIVEVGKIAIVAEVSPVIISVAKQLGLDAIVVMPKQLVDTSFIGLYPDKSLSLEFAKSCCTDDLARDIAARIEKFRLDYEDDGEPVPIFEVYDQIDKDFVELAGIENLVFNESLSGYPFLAGKGAYEQIGGFLARKI